MWKAEVLLIRAHVISKLSKSCQVTVKIDTVSIPINVPRIKRGTRDATAINHVLTLAPGLGVGVVTSGHLVRAAEGRERGRGEHGIVLARHARHAARQRGQRGRAPAHLAGAGLAQQPCNMQWSGTVLLPHTNF